MQDNQNTLPSTPNASEILQNEQKIVESALKFISGGVAGTFSTLLTQPMDVIKTNMILRADAFAKGGSEKVHPRETMMTTARHIYKEQGIKGLYRGTIPTFIRVAPGSLLYYNMLNYLKETTINSKSSSIDTLAKSRLAPTESFFIASFSRGLTGVILCPITVVKTRLEFMENNRGVMETFSHIAKNEGLKGFFAGLFATLVRDIPNAGLNYLFYNQTRYTLTNTFYKGREKEMETSPLITMPSGAVGGVLSSVITHPFDMIRTRLQLEPSSNTKAYNGIIHALVTITKNEGFRTLFRGVSPRIMKRAFASGLGWTILEFLYVASSSVSK